MGGNVKMFEGLPCRMLVGWFLILWGVTFFFGGIWGLIDIVDGYYSIGFAIIELLWDVADLALAGVLAILGLKVLRGDCFGNLLPTA
jgi:hypothetical protein